MLSIGAMKGGQQNYYLDLAREDYYLRGGEPPGVWHGQGAADLGLEGPVQAEALTRLFEGFHPFDDRSLIQQQRYQERENRPGWDLTFSAPKSVSVLWSQADAATRQIIEEVHFAAVKAALNYLEAEVAVSRCGKGGAERTSAKLVIATFEHHTSRAGDPNLHTHCLVMNVGVDAQGDTRTVESRPLYRAKMTAGAIYRAEEAHGLEQRLGVEIERQGNLFEVAGVPQAVCREFSKRRAEIESALAKSGYSGAAASAVAALGTRQVKGHVAQEELFPIWHESAQKQGWGPEQAAQLLREGQLRREGQTLREGQRPSADRSLHPDGTLRHERWEKERALQIAGERATEGQSTFSKMEFTRLLAEECPGRGIGAGELLAARDAYLKESEEIVRLGRDRGEFRSSEFRYSTREMMEQEKALLAAVERSRETVRPGVSEQTTEALITTRSQMAERAFAPEQARALRHLTGAGGGIRVVSGVAGTGKTTLLHAARMAWELEGYEVRGAALNGKAAEGLAEGSGIPSDTLHRTLWDLKRGQLRLDAKSVLVLDEAGMVGTRMMRETVEAVEKAGALLVLTGERRQLQPIEAGGALAAIEGQVGSAQLVEIKRQRQEWARQAVHDFAAGEAGAGLRAYAERGLLHIEKDRKEAMQALIGTWKDKGLRQPQEQLILAGTRVEAAILNRMAQEERRTLGLVQGAGVEIPESNERLYQGDLVLFTKKSRLYGVQNGSRGEVVSAESEKGRLAVRLENGERVEFLLENYAHVKPGYAMTTHKGQGATTEYAFILAGGPMQDREITYVQASRSREQTRIFTDVEEAGETLTRLVRQMSQSREKEMAHTIQSRVDRRTARPGPEPDHGIDF